MKSLSTNFLKKSLSFVLAFLLMFSMLTVGIVTVNAETIPANTVIYFDSTSATSAFSSVYLSVAGDANSSYVANATDTSGASNYTPRADAWYPMTKVSGNIWKATITTLSTVGKISFWNVNESTYNQVWQTNCSLGNTYDATKNLFTIGDTGTYNSGRQSYCYSGTWGTYASTAPSFSDITTAKNNILGNTTTLNSTATIIGGTTPTYSTVCTSANSSTAIIGSSTTSMPTFKATAVGTYTVVTTATNPTTSETATKTYTITVTDGTVSDTNLVSVLKGDKVMFYIGEPVSWGKTSMYINTTNVTTNPTATTTIGGSVTINTVACRFGAVSAAPAQYYVAHASWASGLQMSDNAVGGAYYIVNNSTSLGGSTNNIYTVASKSGFNTYPTTATMNVGDASVEISATLANTTSVVGNTNSVKYYSTTDNATFKEFDPTSTSSLTAGTYTIYPVAYDGTIYVRGSAITLTVSQPMPTLSTPTLSVDKASIKTGETATFTAATTDTGVSYVFTLTGGTTETNTTGVFSVPTSLTAGTYTCTVKTTKTGYNNSASSSSVTLTVNARVYYTANVSVNNSSAGSATINGGTTAVLLENDATEASRTVTLAATANAGYTFVGWSKQSDSTIFSTNATTTTVVSATETYIANFSAIYTVNYSANYSSAGSVSAVVFGEIGNFVSGNTVLTNKSITFTATPVEGYSFKEWKVNGVTSSTTDTSLNLEITANTTVVAVFSINPPTGVALTGAATAYVGQEVTLAASAESTSTLTYLTTCSSSDATITSETTESPVFSATKPGEYTVSLTATATNADGDSNSATSTHTITVSYSEVQTSYNSLDEYMATVSDPTALSASNYYGGQSTIDAYASVYSSVKSMLTGLPNYNDSDIYTAALTNMQQAVTTLKADLILTTIYFKTSSDQTNVYMFTWERSEDCNLTDWNELTKVATGIESGTTYYVWRLQFDGTTNGIITNANDFVGDVKFTGDMIFGTAKQTYYVESNAVSTDGVAVTPTTYNPLAVTLGDYTGTTVKVGDTVDLSALSVTKTGTISEGTGATTTYYVDGTAITGSSWVPTNSGDHTIKIEVTDGYTATLGGALQTATSNQITINVLLADVSVNVAYQYRDVTLNKTLTVAGSEDAQTLIDSIIAAVLNNAPSVKDVYYNYTWSNSGIDVNVETLTATATPTQEVATYNITVINPTTGTRQTFVKEYQYNPDGSVDKENGFISINAVDFGVTTQKAKWYTLNNGIESVFCYESTYNTFVTGSMTIYVDNFISTVLDQNISAIHNVTYENILSSTDGTVVEKVKLRFLASATLKSGLAIADITQIGVIMVECDKDGNTAVDTSKLQSYFSGTEATPTGVKILATAEAKPNKDGLYIISVNIKNTTENAQRYFKTYACFAVKNSDGTIEYVVSESYVIASIQNS